MSDNTAMVLVVACILTAATAIVIAGIRGFVEVVRIKEQKGTGR